MTQQAPSLEKLLAGAQLPALPQSAIRLLELSQDPENGPAEFAIPIEADPGLAGQVLRFVNSSYFGFSREISSVKLAITLVGVRTIKNFALWSAVFSLMPNPKCGPFDLRSLWQDSLRRGIFARTFGRLLGLKDAEDLFAASLLQDMAVPLLAKELADEYVKLLENRDDGVIRLSQLEKEAFGWTHADAAAAMARQWSLPEEFAKYIECHIDIDGALSRAKEDPGAAAVCVSSLLPAASDTVWQNRDEFTAIYQQLNNGSFPDICDLLKEVDNAFEEFAPILKIKVPAKSLADFYAEEPVAQA